MGSPISGQAKSPNLGQYSRAIALSALRVNRDGDADTQALGVLMTGGLYGGKFPGGMVFLNNGGGGSGAATIFPPWFPFSTQDGSGNYEANFYPGTIGGVLPTNAFTPVALTQSVLNYLYAAMTASAGVVTAATITASTSYPALASANSGSPPTSFNIPLGTFDLTGTPILYNLVGFGNIWAQPYVTSYATAGSPTVLSAPFTVSYNWEWGAGN